MSSFIMTVTVAVGFFAVCMLAMAIGLFVRGVVLRGGCHSQSAQEGGSCGVCGGEGKGECRRRGRQRGKPAEANSV
ncbi:MAG: hypothetical protein K8T26_20455 [Lentisphaerae bacterium]|nr:hypothetical protein [Lentisphaerota bacterium]